MTARWRLLCLTALLLVSGPLAAQGLDEAIAAYQRGDYQAALAPMLNSAQQGDPVAQVYMGLIYYNGHGVREDDATSIDWFRLAADQGDPEGQFQLGYMYLYGYGVAPDEPDPEAQAAEWFARAAEQGHAEAQFNLGLMLMSGSGVTQDEQAGVRLIEQAAANGSPGAKRFTGSYNR